MLPGTKSVKYYDNAKKVLTYKGPFNCYVVTVTRLSWKRDRTVLSTKLYLNSWEFDFRKCDLKLIHTIELETPVLDCPPPPATRKCFSSRTFTVYIGKSDFAIAVPLSGAMLASFHAKEIKESERYSLDKTDKTQSKLSAPVTAQNLL